MHLDACKHTKRQAVVVWFSRRCRRIESALPCCTGGLPLGKADDGHAVVHSPHRMPTCVYSPAVTTRSSPCQMAAHVVNFRGERCRIERRHSQFVSPCPTKPAEPMQRKTSTPTICHTNTSCSKSSRQTQPPPASGMDHSISAAATASKKLQARKSGSSVPCAWVATL